MDEDLSQEENTGSPDFSIEVVADDSELLDHPIIGVFFER